MNYDSGTFDIVHPHLDDPIGQVTLISGEVTSTSPDAGSEAVFAAFLAEVEHYGFLGAAEKWHVDIVEVSSA